MEVNRKNLQYFSAQYQITTVPPPYSYQYHIECWFHKGHLHVRYDIKYLDRENVDEDEILEEGFSPDDDFSWEGDLPEIWNQAIIKMVEGVIFKSRDDAASGHDPSLILTWQDIDGNEEKGTPENNEAWEYFLQELVQAVYEESQKETPLVIHYKEVNQKDDITKITIKPKFSTRHIEALWQHTLDEDVKKMIPWKNLKKLLKEIYLPDYNYENAMEEEPTHNGKFIDHGEGLWFEFHKDVTNPGQKHDALKNIEDSLKEIFN